MINYQEVHGCYAHVHILFVQPESGIFGLRELTRHISELTQSGPNPPEYGCTQRQRCTCMHVRMYACMGVCTYLRTYYMYYTQTIYIPCLYYIEYEYCACVNHHCSCIIYLSIHHHSSAYFLSLLEHCFERL